MKGVVVAVPSKGVNRNRSIPGWITVDSINRTLHTLAVVNVAVVGQGSILFMMTLSILMVLAAPRFNEHF